MLYRESAPVSLRSAIFYSIAVHLCVLTALGLLVRPHAPLADADAEVTGSPMLVSITHRIRLALQPVVVRATPVAKRTIDPASAAPRTPTPGARPRSLPRLPGASSAVVARAPQAIVQTSDAHRRATQVFTALPSAKPPLAVVTAVPLLPSPLPIPSPTPVPTSTPPAAAGAPAGFGGLFSQNYPPAFPPAAPVISHLRLQLTAPVHVRIQVDEDGHATDVQFPGASPDAAQAREIRTELLDVRYVPADCNGLHCDGTLDLVI